MQIVPCVQEFIPGSDRGNSDGAEIPRLLRSFRHFIVLAFLGSVFLPPLAYLSSPSIGGVIPSSGEFYLQVGLYGVPSLAAIVGLYLQLLKLEPYLYALSRSKEGIPLILTLPLLTWQFVLLIALRWGLPNRPYSLKTIPFREQLNMGLTATWDQIGVVYLLLTVVFLLTALAFVPVGQRAGLLTRLTCQGSDVGPIPMGRRLIIWQELALRECRSCVFLSLANFQ